MTPQRIGRYEVLYPLSRGGMAVVLLARDPAFERQVAIKVLPPQFTNDPQFRGRFEREAKVIAGLEHPYIVPVYDYGEEGNQPYIVMRFMPGGTLADRIGGQPMPLDQVVLIQQRMAEAIDAVHRHGIIHCDMKPSNVLFDVEGRAFLSDFGISKLLEVSPNSSASNILIGTPAYMSPEQCIGGATLDGRSDIYSMGLILYEMLSGHHPYGEQDMSTGEMMRKQISEPPAPLDTDKLGLPGEINSILAWALAKQPEARYATAGMMARSLMTVYSENAPSISKPVMGLRISRPISPLMPTPSGRSGNATTEVLNPTRPLPDVVGEDRRRRWIIGGLVGLPACLIVGGLAWWGLGFLAGGGTTTPTPTATLTPMTSLVSPVPTNTIPPTTTGVSVIASETTTLSDTPTPTVLGVSVTDTSTPSLTPTHTSTPTKTRRPVTALPTNTATASPTTLPTNTPIPPTNPPQPTDTPVTPTVTPVPPTPVPPTDTPVPPTEPPTPVPP